MAKYGVVILNLNKYNQRVNKIEKPPTCFSCATELKVGDKIHTQATSGARAKLVRWRCLKCAKRLYLY